MFTMLLLLAIFPLSFQLVPGSPFFGGQGALLSAGNDDSNSWINEPLCVLQVSSKCPTGFTFHQLRLSVQPDVNPKDKNLLGDDLMHLGEAGNSKLQYDQYDRLYTLTLAFCCK